MKRSKKLELKTQNLSSSFENNSQNNEFLNQVFKPRINRIIGQIKGVERMIKESRPCDEVLQQINAIKKAIDGLSKEILISDICRIVPKEKSEELKKIMKRAISL